MKGKERYQPQRQGQQLPKYHKWKVKIGKDRIEVIFFYKFECMSFYFPIEFLFIIY